MSGIDRDGVGTEGRSVSEWEKVGSGSVYTGSEGVDKGTGDSVSRETVP